MARSRPHPFDIRNTCDVQASWAGGKVDSRNPVLTAIPYSGGERGDSNPTFRGTSILRGRIPRSPTTWPIQILRVNPCEVQRGPFGEESPLANSTPSCPGTLREAIISKCTGDMPGVRNNRLREDRSMNVKKMGIWTAGILVLVLAVTETIRNTTKFPHVLPATRLAEAPEAVYSTI